MNISIMGCYGKMGRNLVTYIQQNTSFSISYGVTRKNTVNDLGIRITDSAEKAIEASDVIIDFTRPDFSLSNIELCVQYKKPIIVGTTGFSSSEDQKILEYSNAIAIGKSFNMSIGVHIVSQLTEIASRLLSQENFDAEILESHHKSKVDAPSGTAILLGKSVAKGREQTYENIVNNNRMQETRARNVGELGMSSIRGGSIVGEHTVLFLGENEQIELKHKAINRNIFSAGAVDFAKWIVNQPKGLYCMRDLINSMNLKEKF